MHSFRKVKYKCGPSKAGVWIFIYCLVLLTGLTATYAKKVKNPAIFLVIKSSLIVEQVIFLKGPQQTRFFYNILVLKDIRLTAAAKVTELGGICSSGSFAELQTERRHKEDTFFGNFFFSHTLLDSRNMTPDSWSFVLTTTFIVIVSYLYTWASFQLLKAFNVWTVIKLFCYELI